MAGVRQNGLELLAPRNIDLPEESRIRLVFLLQMGNDVNYLGPNSRVRVSSHSPQQIAGISQLILLKADQMSSCRPDPVIWRTHQPFQKSLPYLPVVMKDPEPLQDGFIPLLLL